MGVQIRFTKINLGVCAKFDFSVVGAHFSVVGGPLFSAAENTEKSGRSPFRGRKGARDAGGGAAVVRFWQIFYLALDKSGLFAPQ
jgi:hypothetical protein